MLILPLPLELMNALGAGTLDGAKPDEATPLRLFIMLPSMYHIKGLVPPEEVWEGVVLVAWAVEVVGASMLPNWVVSTLSQEKFKSMVLPDAFAAVSQSSLLL